MPGNRRRKRRNFNRRRVKVAPNMPVMMFTGTLPSEKPETVDAVVGKPVALTTFRETVARVISAVIRPPPIIDELD